MKVIARTKYFAFVLLFVVFVFLRVFYNIKTNNITELDFQGLALSSASFPFGIIKETALNSNFTPLYFILIHFFKNITLLRIINGIFAFLTAGVMFLTGKALYGRALGYFLAFFLSVNHFFILYTNQISPYCLSFLIISLLIYSLVCFLKKQTKLNFLLLAIFNCAFIFADNFGFLFVGCELLVFYLICGKTKYLKQSVKKLFLISLIAFIVLSPILIIQFYNSIIQIIPDFYSGIGLNLTSFFLMINDYFSPYLSFDVPEFQSKTTLAMLYSYIKTCSFWNLNSLKLFITLFYGSFLPLALLIFFIRKTVFKNRIFKILFYISISYFAFLMLLMMYQTIDVKPVYTYPFFFVCLIFLGLGIFQLKDKILRSFIIVSLFLIQFLQPNLNSFDIVLSRQTPTVNVFNQFIEQYQITPYDVIIMPYLGKYARFYYKGLNFADIDYNELKTNSKKSVLKGLVSKDAQKINKYSAKYYLEDFLLNYAPNDYLRQYFNDTVTDKLSNHGRIILFVDKINTKPYSNSQIFAVAKNNKYSTKLRKIDFNKNVILSNPYDELYSSLKSRFLYDIIFLLEENYILSDIAEYKKIDSEFYNLNLKNSLAKALNNKKSDYAFFIFK